jgi:repressor LexA
MVKITSLQSRVLQFILQNIDTAGVPPTLREIAHHFGWKAVGSAQDVIASLRKKGFLEPVSPGRARQTLPTDSAYLLFGKTPQEGSVRRSGTIRGAHSSQGGGSLPQRLRSKGGSRAKAPEPVTQTLWDVSSDQEEAWQSLPSPWQHNNPTDDQADDHIEDINAVRVPLLGTVRAGHPAEAILQPDGYVTLPRHDKMRNNGLFYAVEVDGYSMVGAGMIPGDILLVEAVPQAKSGDVTLAAVGSDQEVTLKRFALKGSPLYRQALGRTPFSQQNKETWPPALLVPENDDFDPIPFGFEPSDRIVGLVRSLFRPDLN